MVRFFKFPRALVCFLIFIAAGLAAADNAPSDANTNWSLIHDLNASGQYEAAFKALLSAPASPNSPNSNDATYFYNLGTLAYRIGRPGAALGYFERANHLKRHDPDIRHNLDIVSADLAHTLGENKLDPASSLTEIFADQVSLEEIRGVLGLVALLLVLFWIRAYRGTRRLKDALLSPAPVTGSLALAIVAIIYLVEIQANAHAPAIAVERQSVRSGPGLSYNELAQLEAGTKVRLLGESPTGTAPDGSPTSEPWLQVRYTQDGIGWVRALSLIKLE